MAREMKDSGIEWIGEIPRQWNIAKVKFLVSDIKSGEANNNLILEEGLFPVYGGGSQIGYSDNWNTENNILIGRVGAKCGCVTRISGKAWATDNALIVVSDNSNWLYYAFIALDLHNLNTSNAQPLITASKVMNCFLPFPSLEEQLKIISFLDSKCAEIDKAIEATKASIEEYRKLKQAIITEVVTKGLDPDVEMKDSGIEWLGYVPKAWGVRQLKSCVNVLRGGSPRPIDEYLTDDIDGLNWIKIGDTEKGKRYINSVRQKIKKSGLSKTRQVHRGDLLLTNSMSFGEPYILNVDGCIHDGWLVFTDIKEIDKEYLYYFLLSSTCKDQFSITADGGVVQNLNIEKVQSSIILLPVISEQHKIVDYLNTKCSEIDSLIKSKEKLIEELTAYRKSLIYEYVTGKKEVPIESA